jgi:hypothetical protein
MRRAFRLAALAAILTAAAAGLAAAQPVVLLRVAPAEGDRSPRVGEIVSRAARLELERAGLEAAPAGAPPQDADFVLEASFTVTGREVRLVFAWYTAGGMRRTQEVTLRGRMDLSLDRLVAEAVRGILRRESASLAEAAARRPPPAPAPGEPPADAAPAVVDPATAGAAEGEPSAAPSAESSTTARTAGAAKRFELAAGSSLFLPVGRAAEYLKMGVFPSLSASYYFGRRRGRLGVGLCAGANLFRAQGDLASAESVLLPLGLDLRFTTRPDLPLALLVRLSGGAAVLGANLNGSGMLYKTIPYASAGLGLYLWLFRSGGVVLDGTCSVFFEGQIPIVGYAPGFGLYLRL